MNDLYLEEDANWYVLCKYKKTSYLTDDLNDAIDFYSMYESYGAILVDLTRVSPTIH